jgi:hypothetical protein
MSLNQVDASSDQLIEMFASPSQGTFGRPPALGCRTPDRYRAERYESHLDRVSTGSDSDLVHGCKESLGPSEACL